MSDTAHNIDAYLAATEPPPPEPVDKESTTSVGVAEPDEDDSASAIRRHPAGAGHCIAASHRRNRPVTTDPSNPRKPPGRPLPG